MAIHWTVCIWVSDGFKTKSTRLHDILQSALALPYSRWAEVSMEGFMRFGCLIKADIGEANIK